MIKLAVYGKGGIGKSTTVSNLAAAMAEKGLRVMQIGCDPKADSTAILHGGTKIPTVLELVRKYNNDFALDDMVCVGFDGVICVEAGGPLPGRGCAGRGIIAALEKLAQKGAYETYKPDVVMYDVLGDVVCGGFSMPMHGGYADSVFIITSGENMSIYAAANIAMAVEDFKGRGYASLGGLILNRRNVKNEEKKVKELAADFHTEIAGALDLSETVRDAELLNKTVIEAFPDSKMASQYRSLSENILHMHKQKRRRNSVLKKINGKAGMIGEEIRIRDAEFPSPFLSGLEYNAPARGPWNIVHTGMLIPQSHQVFVCAEGCLRGVILTAAEMNAMDRMSWVSVHENDLLDGSMERNIVDGTADILNKMDTLPPAVLVFISCIHLFTGCDFKVALTELSTRFPGVDFVECYMTPTMRKSGLTMDQIMRRQLYSPLRSVQKNKKYVNIIGNDRPTDESSEFVSLIRGAGFEIRDIALCKTYGDYLKMAESAVNITYLPAAFAAGEELCQRLGQNYLYLPLSYSYKEIMENYRKLSNVLEIKMPDFSDAMDRADKALKDAYRIIGNIPIAIDYTSTPRPLGLARLLVEHDFAVKKVYVDSFLDEDGRDFVWLKENKPELVLSSTVHPKMRFAAHGSHDEKVLAIGQKAAYFNETGHFVNIVAGGGMYGFDGIVRLAEMMTDAYLHEKDVKTVIQYKGLGCESCL
ncbi:putative Nitrogenase [Clostridiaceae bacterium BL-3]|nr:putative Nitrogenase [Clostridiaceae bacterium BL-3]